MGPSLKYARNKNHKFRPPTPVRFQIPLLPAYVRTFNTEYYSLLITQNRKTLKTPKFLESF